MQQQDVAELLRASTSDAGTVAQYLVSIDREELNGLLDGFAAYEVKKKNDHQQQQRGDWLALVQLLLRSETARLRTATRIIQLVWNGSASELECMQWLTEISLGYLGALEDDTTSNSSHFNGDSTASSTLTTRIRFAAIADEVRMLLRIVFELLSDGIEAHGTANARKALPQMLSLLPILLGVLVELTNSSGSKAEKGEQELHENLVKLLELPWSTRSIPLLLDLLKESASIVSTSGWNQLQENMERMVTGAQELPSESMNPIIRECVSIASVTGDAHWIDIARHVFRQLPPRLRQEAEFNLQMCLHQSHNAVALVCASIRVSLEHESSDSRDEHESPEGGGELKLQLDWRDLVFLFHALQVSKPILHHRTTSSRIATDATVFTEIERLTWAIFRLDLERYQSGKASNGDASGALDLPKYLTERVAQLLTFGGKQVHSREWKALLLMDFAFYWIESDTMRLKKPSSALMYGNGRDAISNAIPSKDALARLLLLAVFQSAPEIRSEMLSNLFEGAKSPERAQCSLRPMSRSGVSCTPQVAGKALDQLFRSQPTTLFPHLNAIQDWLSVLFQSHFCSARAFFLMASQLTTVHKDLYSFLMVFLRKLLSVTNPMHQQFAIDLWCSWLEQGLHFDALQEEEIVSALKNSLLVCQGTHAWVLGRLERLFHLDKQGKANIKLRRSSWEELHRMLSSELSQFLRPRSTNQSLSSDSHDAEFGDEADDDDEDSSSRRHHFQLSALDHFYHQNSSADGAAAVGLVFQKALSCLLSFEAAAAQDAAEDGLPLLLPAVGADLLHWIVDFVSNWEFFFHWIAQSSDDEDEDDNADGDFGGLRGLNQRPSGAKASEKKMMWRLLSRIGIGSALCSVAIQQQLLRNNIDSSTDSSGGGSISSIWPLLEVQLCLHRLLRKLVTTHAAAIDVKQSKEYLAASFYGISSVIDARSAQILGEISSRLAGESSSSDSGERDATKKTGSGLSFDSMLFVLDSCCNSAPVAEGGLLSQVNSIETRSGVLKALLKLYVTVRDQVFSTSRLSDSSVDSEPRSVFTVYADSLVLKFPKLLRHLVATAKSAKQVVLLDAKAAEDVLVRIFAAIGRTLDRMTEVSGAKPTDRSILRLMTTKADRKANGDNGGVLALAAVLLQDLKLIMAQRELTKLKLTTALLVKRLCDLGADVAGASSSSIKDEALVSQLLDLALTSYDVMCEHAVYHAPLLRALLSICFCVHIGKDIGSVVKLAGCMEGFLLTSGFDIALLSTIRRLSRRARRKTTHNSVAASPPPEPYANQEPVTPSKRKRLRQTPATVPSSVVCDSNEDDEEAESVHREPHLPSSEAQSAAVLALLTLMEAAQATLFRQLSMQKRTDQRVYHSDNTVSTMLCARMFELVLRALLTAKNASWVSNAKVLLKLLSVIEWSLRLGKASCITGGSSPGSRELGSSDTDHISSSVTSSVDVLDGAVQIALQARVWVDLLKENIKESATKTKLSATSLKIDVFLLNVPQLIESFSRDVQAPLTESLRGRIQVMLAQITDQMAPSSASGTTPTKKQRGGVNAHMLGVVPIVKKRKKRLRSRHPCIDDWLRDEDGSDAYADLEDFIE